jgi:hypothetical protein
MQIQTFLRDQRILSVDCHRPLHAAPSWTQRPRSAAQEF